MTRRPLGRRPARDRADRMGSVHKLRLSAERQRELDTEIVTESPEQPADPPRRNP